MFVWADHGADPLLENNQGKTVLDVLQSRGRHSDVRRVIQASTQSNRYYAYTNIQCQISIPIFPIPIRLYLQTNNAHT